MAQANNNALTRRDVLQSGVATSAALLSGGWSAAAQAGASAPAAGRAARFDISIAAWSLHRELFAGKIKQIDLPKVCREDFDISGLELVNTFFPSPQYSYCRDLKRRADDLGVRILLIMCDSEGDMSAPDAGERRQAVRNHRKWLDIALTLGCHSIRCNSGNGNPGNADAIARCAESFAALVDHARGDKLNVIIENHGGLSSDPESLVAVMKRVNDPLFGTLPDFGNFPDSTDRYAAVAAMMPYAKAVSAKCHAFDASGNETKTDFARMMKIVLDAGYAGFVGIEYEGPNADERAGIRACQKLLQRFQ